MAVPPNLFRQYVKSTLQRGRSPLHFWLSSRSYFQRLDEWLRQRTIVDRVGDFPFDLVEVQDFELEEWEGDWGRLKGLRLVARMIEVAVEGSVTGTSSGRLGAAWRGRPTIYLISFDGQPDDTRNLSSEARAALAKIMLRTEGEDAKPNPDGVLGPDLRTFGDCSIFMNEAVTLWVFGGRALRAESRQANWPDLVYDNQVKVEWIEHRFMAHQQLHESAALPHRRVSALADKAGQLSLLQQATNRASSFGEIKQLLKRADECLELSAVRQEIRANLERKEMVLAEDRETHARWFGWTLTVLLGLVGVPALSTSVVDPLWRYFGWWLQSIPELQKPMLSALTMIGICLIVVFVWGATYRRRRPA